MLVFWYQHNPLLAPLWCAARGTKAGGIGITAERILRFQSSPPENCRFQAADPLRALIPGTGITSHHDSRTLNRPRESIPAGDSREI